jgi:hypothetical protein
MSKSVKVIFDTNMLLAPFQFKVDVLTELEEILSRKVSPLILSSTREELFKMRSSGKPKMAKLAQLALELADRCQVIEAKPAPGETIDDVLLRKARELKCAVATNDRGLLKRLREKGVPRIFLRQRRLLSEGAFI